ncbi:hypothetical protein I4F81_002066 [Pyropia yezoensis]|uniref:Uncharacterized protein n=1 Tax=Pyropia yezoensis TaxID=2788 RepID=A0ACC3BNC5_PYRYE|nr:hypothetical protein I4F81_002066 [Neopyropia yezoensis]
MAGGVAFDARLLAAFPAATSLSLAAGFCSGLGGLLAVTLDRRPSLERLALWQGAVGGVLLCWSWTDVLPEAAAGLRSGPRAAALFAGGVAVMWAASMALRRTGVGGRPRRPGAGGDPGGGLGVGEGDAGRIRGVGSALVAPTAGDVPLSVSIGAAEPRDGGDGNSQDDAHVAEVLACARVTFLALAAHNMLEGAAIFLASYEGLDKGLPLAFAVGLENVPEGMAIAFPLYFATRSRWVAVGAALASGLFEPAGVAVVAAFMRPWFGQELVSSALAVLSGIMVFLSAFEMLPLAVKHSQGGGGGAMPRLSSVLGAGVLGASLVSPLLINYARIGTDI